jgi:hypothetical protein
MTKRLSRPAKIFKRVDRFHCQSPEFGLLQNAREKGVTFILVSQTVPRCT